MNYNELQAGLNEYPKAKVLLFLEHIKNLENAKNRDGTLKNKWVPYLKPNQLIYVFEKVHNQGLVLDGDSVTLQFRGSLLISYNYQAYKNLLLQQYPETKFDMQLVYDTDHFAFKKVNGNVMYEHNIIEPFKTKKNIVGAYCIIKNKRGDFIETVNMDDITKMKNVAKTTKIWDEWFGEMVMKSVIKRACKRHFKDIVSSVDEEDNNNYNTEDAGFDFEMKKKIENCKTEDDLQTLYNLNKEDVKDEVTFLKLLKERENELKKVVV